MDTLKIPKEAEVRLQTNISSDAIVATTVSINNAVVKKSSKYRLTTELGHISSLPHKGLSVVSQFFVAGGNLDEIMASTQVSNLLSYDGKQEELQVVKQKITDFFFIAYSSAILKS